MELTQPEGNGGSTLCSVDKYINPDLMLSFSQFMELRGNCQVILTRLDVSSLGNGNIGNNENGIGVGMVEMQEEDQHHEQDEEEAVNTASGHGSLRQARKGERQLKKRRKPNVRIQTVKQPYKGQNHGHSFGGKDNRETHVTIVHKKKRKHKCVLCGRRLSLRSNLYRHMRSHTICT